MMTPAPAGTPAPAPTAVRRAEETLPLGQLDAVLFDLDGVLTDTASLHEKAWAATFAEAFAEIDRDGTPRPAPFTSEDYRRLVDGRPRLDGVRAVLTDRGLHLPEGSPADPPGAATAWSIAAAKDARFTALVDTHGVLAFPGTHRLLGRLRAAGVDVAVVSASRHATDVLAAAGLTSLANTVVDGNVAAAMGLPGKPDPATYREAADRLGVDPARAAVVEDALAGVAAGRAGGFGTVIGIDHHGDPTGLREAGADLVVTGLDHLAAAGPGPLTDGWHLTYRPTAEAAVGRRETLLTLANGYLGTRGAATWVTDDGVHYPGTYLAGLYNRLTSDVEGVQVDRESIVNAPNWLPLSFAAGDGPYLGETGVTVTAEEQRLGLHTGILRHRYQVCDSAGRRTSVIERRLVSMTDPHLAALRIDLIAENWSGELRVRSGIDATCCADQTTEAKQLAHCHLQLVETDTPDGATMVVAARTTGTATLLATATRTRLTPPTDSPVPRQLVSGHGTAGPAQEYQVPIRAGQRLRVEKTAAFATSRDPAVIDPAAAALAAAGAAPGFGEIAQAHRAAWARLWHQVHTEVHAAGRPAALVNLHLFHLLQVASPHLRDIDAGLPARGLHGEGYEGHVFWDELFATRVLDLRIPETSRAALAYRRRRLPAARRAARTAGEAGARYPWQSAADGRDVTPHTLYNPRSGRWMPDRSAAQRHVGLAVAYEALHHLETTDDGFLDDAATIVFAVARNFAHLAEHDPATDRYHLRAVMGPDEFHDGYPWRTEAGVDDNAYTNVLTAWLCARATELTDRLSATGRGDLLTGAGIDSAERDLFETVSRRMYVPFHAGVISQFADYDRLANLDLDTYRAKYGNIGRLDLILEAEGDGVRGYQVAKQADVLMLLYLLSPAALQETLRRLGYEVSEQCLRETIDYYDARTVHGSTLSTVVHAWVTARLDPSTSWRSLTAALAADMADTQGGTTAEGIHLGAMAGTIDLLQRCYLGLDSRAGGLHLDPALPVEIDRLRVALAYRGHHLDITADHTDLVIAAAEGAAAPIPVTIHGQRHSLAPGGRLHHRLPTAHKPAAQPAAPTEEEPVNTTITDPVCGMSIEASTAAASTTYHGVTYYFCSPTCRATFDADPDRYAVSAE